MWIRKPSQETTLSAKAETALIITPFLTQHWPPPRLWENRRAGAILFSSLQLYSPIPRAGGGELPLPPLTTSVQDLCLKATGLHCPLPVDRVHSHHRPAPFRCRQGATMRKHHPSPIQAPPPEESSPEINKQTLPNPSARAKLRAGLGIRCRRVRRDLSLPTPHPHTHIILWRCPRIPEADTKRKMNWRDLGGRGTLPTPVKNASLFRC